MAYCGKQSELPPNYERFGDRNECFHKGIEIGMHSDAKPYHVMWLLKWLVDGIILSALLFTLYHIFLNLGLSSTLAIFLMIAISIVFIIVKFYFNL